MRARVYQWLSNDPTLSAVVGNRVFPVNMEDISPTRPFIVYRISSATPRIVPAKNQILQLWFHDDRGDYTRIDNLLERAKVVLENQSEPDIFGIEWLDDSEDLYDEVQNTINRYTRYQVVMSNG